MKSQIFQMLMQRLFDDDVDIYKEYFKHSYIELVNNIHDDIDAIDINDKCSMIIDGAKLRVVIYVLNSGCITETFDLSDPNSVEDICKYISNHAPKRNRISDIR